jgi:2-aminoadipate transaminase
MEKLVVAKQASDLHTCYFVQRILSQYLADNSIDEHIKKIVAAYGSQCRAMMNGIAEHFPKSVKWTKPEGGMLLWVSLPEGTSSLRLFDLAIKDGVAFVPGKPFYVNRADTNTARLNFSCVDEATIGRGIERLGKAIRQLLSR